MATAARDGLLRRPAPGGGVPEFLQPATLPPDSAPAAFCLDWFLTDREALAPYAEPYWRMVGSLAAAIPRTGDANAERVASVIAHVPGQDRPSNYGGPDDRYSRLFAGAVAGDTPYHRALVDAALNRLRYWGYGDRFYRDLRAAADDPNAFPRDIPYIGFWEDMNWKNGVNAPLPKDFKHDSGTTWDEHRSILRHAKSPTISAWLLQNMSKPTDADVQSMARFLDSPDPRLRRAFLERLAACNGEPAPEEPRPARDAQGRFLADAQDRTTMEHPGLDVAVARWKARLRALPHAP